MHQSTINGEAPDAADTSDSDAATSDTDDEATTSEPEFKLVLEDVPPASYEITSSPTAPGGGSVHTLTINLGAPGHPDPIIIETGKIGRQASAAVTLTRGESVL